jgi:organic radical activating enzyme
MRVLLVVPFLTIFCLPANAQQQTPEQNMTVGSGVICDTARQAERFATLRSNGKDAELAIHAVNDEAKNGGACRFAFVVFTGGEPIAELSVNARPVTILAITVHAFGNGRTWNQVPATVQYTLVTEKGLIV